MRYLIYSDIHWSTISSLVRGRGTKYSDRLEHLVMGLNWAEDLAEEMRVDKILCLGDFFDSPTLEQEAITALNDITWSDIPHQFLVGNHESSLHDLKYNSANIMKKFGFEVINEVKYEDDGKIVFIPYIPNKSRESFSYYVKDKDAIVFSHNDIAGIQFGEFFTVDGFDLEEIHNGCKIFLNGHIHNRGVFKGNVINVGSMAAHNLTNDSSLYDYGVWVFDTESLDLQFFENPTSFKFYKIDVNEDKDVRRLENLPYNSVVSIKSKEKYVEQVKKILKESVGIKYSRLVVVRDLVEAKEEVKENLTIDYRQKLINFIYEQVGVSDLITDELTKICEREV